MEPKKIIALLNEYIIQKEAMSSLHIIHITELKNKDPHEAKIHAAKYRILINAVNDDFLNNAAEKVGVDLNLEHIGENGVKKTLREVITLSLLPILDQTILSNFDEKFNALFN